MPTSILSRRLKEGMTYEDFRRAWLPDRGFGVSTRVVSAQSLEDRRDVVTIGFSDLEPEEAAGFLERIGPQEVARHDCLAEVVEPEMSRALHVQVADDDLADEPPPA